MIYLRLGRKMSWSNGLMTLGFGAIIAQIRADSDLGPSVDGEHRPATLGGHRLQPFRAVPTLLSEGDRWRLCLALPALVAQRIEHLPPEQKTRLCCVLRERCRYRGETLADLVVLTHLAASRCDRHCPSATPSDPDLRDGYGTGDRSLELKRISCGLSSATARLPARSTSGGMERTRVCPPPPMSAMFSSATLTGRSGMPTGAIGRRDAAKERKGRRESRVVLGSKRSPHLRPCAHGAA